LTTGTVAAFDFDGTLTRADTLVPFLQRLCGTRTVVRALVAEFGTMARAVAGMGERDEAKAVLLARLLAGRAVTDIEAVVAVYTDLVIAKQLRPDTVARVEWHRAQGHELLVVSASPELYVRPIAERLHFDGVLATRLEVDGDGHLTGRLDGANVRAQEKVRRIEEWLDDRAVTLWAYGNSSGDRPMLDRADVGVMVTRRQRLPATPAEKNGPP
jgi:phosphatidylglycerophosphatase C